MNLRPFIALLAAMPLAFIGGCTPDETVEPPVITVENSSITVPADAHTGKLTYSITNPVEGSQVEAESNQDWIHTFNYDTENTITFEVDANVSDERTAEITISYPQAEPVTVTVTQMAAGESIALDPETLSFLPAGGDLSVTVNSGRAWVMTGESDWVSASAASGDPGAQVTFTAQANESDEPREATFQFICGTNVVPLTVTQSFAGRIIVEKAEYDIPGTANTFSIAVFFCLLVRSRVLSVALVVWSLVNCWTRIYLGVHYPGDILCGLLWGGLVGAAVYWAYTMVGGKAKAAQNFISSQYTSTGYQHSDVNVVMLVLSLTFIYALVRACLVML